MRPKGAVEMLPGRFEHESRGPERRVAPHARNVSHLFESGRRHSFRGPNHNHRTALRLVRFRREIVGRFEPVAARDLALACVSRDSTRPNMV